jgi:sugar phosphate isomerase/epimerase
MSRPEAGPFTIGVSLVAFSSAAAIRRFAVAAWRRYQREALFELSYTSAPALLEELTFLLSGSPKGSVVSSHAPCPATELFPNLGSRDPAVVAESLQTIRRSAATAAAFGADLLVLHAGYTTDAGVFSDSRRRLEALAASRDPEDQSWLWLERGTVCRPGYCRSPRYRAHLETAVGNLRQAASLCADHGVRLTVENLNPRLTYLFQLPGELIELVRDIPEIALCVDLGHLWISSLVHGFDFREGLQEMLRTGRVATVHVHDNASTLGPPPALGDDHALIGSGRVPIREALSLLAAAGVRRLVIESPKSALDNYARLLRLLSRA